MGKVKFSEELFEQICEDIATSSDGLYRICKNNNIVTSTFYKWIAEDEKLAERYMRARDMQADFMVDQIIEIADDTSRDSITVSKESGDYDIPNTEWINRSKLRVEARKWIAAKLRPKKYGDRTEVDLTTKGESLNLVTKIEVVHTNGADPKGK